MKENMGLRGKVHLILWSKEGKILRENHNIITDEGDALLADLLSETPTRTKVDNSNGIIQLGTGWTGNSTKSNQGCNTPVTGGERGLDAGFPLTKGVWGDTDDNVVIYQSSFPAGSMEQDGIDEVALLNGTSGDCLAYAQVTPVANMALTDSLQIVWEISFLGS